MAFASGLRFTMLICKMLWYSFIYRCHINGFYYPIAIVSKLTIFRLLETLTRLRANASAFLMDLKTLALPSPLAFRALPFFNRTTLIPFAMFVISFRLFKHSSNNTVLIKLYNYTLIYHSGIDKTFKNGKSVSTSSTSNT